MLPNAAKTAKMLIRRQKRASTWIDLSSCGRFGSCAKFETLVCAFYTYATLSEVFAVERRILLRSCLWNRGAARLSR
jgi:hypothetical protein